MRLSDAEALIRGGVERKGGTWADLGSGNGTFTLALAGLLGQDGTVHAIDKSSSALSELERSSREAPGAGITTTIADFTQTLPLSDLDGVVMANSLHFIERGRQEQVVALVCAYLRAGGALVVVEYDQVRGNPWVPHPVPPQRFAELARGVGLREPVEIGRLRSQYGPRDIYAAVAYLRSP